MNAERVLLDRVFPRTLDAMVAEFSDASWQGGRVEGWVFEDGAARRAAEWVLEARGVAARFRAAYKPLLHGFLEEFGMRQATIGVPSHALGSERRFRLEAYPLAGLVKVPVQFSTGTALLDYDMTLRHPEGDRRLLPDLRRDGA